MWGLAALLDDWLARRDDDESGAAGSVTAGILTDASPAVTDVPAILARELGSTPMQRALARWPHLAPRDGSVDAYLDWIATFPEGDIEAVFDLDAGHAVMCRLAGFEPVAEPTAETVAEAMSPPDNPVSPPDMATPEGDATEMSPLGDIEVEADEVMTGPVTLKAPEAAERFVEWVRLAGKANVAFTSNEFTAIYRQHCEAEELTALPDNVIRSALAALEDDVRRTRDDKYMGKRRRRGVRWTILPAPEAELIPWPELARREAA